METNFGEREYTIFFLFVGKNIKDFLDISVTM